MANEVFNVYADLSCSPESFVMSAPLDVLRWTLALRDAACKRIVTETANGEPCVIHDNAQNKFPLRLTTLVVVKRMTVEDSAIDYAPKAVR